MYDVSVKGTCDIAFILRVHQGRFPWKAYFISHPRAGGCRGFLLHGHRKMSMRNT